jgi:hypothetical protein
MGKGKILKRGAGAPLKHPHIISQEQGDKGGEVDDTMLFSPDGVKSE